jgi:drug/metabolite transporter (DMT)-like permease
VCAIAAVSIWAGWMVVARLGVTTSLTALDVTAIRFGVAGLILLPVLLRRGLALDRLGWLGFAALAVGGGAPTVLLASFGVWFARAADGGALFPGAVPLFVSLFAAVILRESFPPARRIGLALILMGVLALVGVAGLSEGGFRSVGHLLFLGAAFLWAGYTIAMRRARLDGLHAAAIGAVMSLAVYLPIYAVRTGTALLSAPWHDIAVQAVVQGVLTVVVSQYLYGRAVDLFRRVARGRVRGARAGDGRGDGDSIAWRVAGRPGLDRDRCHLDRRLSRRRRAVAEAARLFLNQALGTYMSNRNAGVDVLRWRPRHDQRRCENGARRIRAQRDEHEFGIGDTRLGPPTKSAIRRLDRPLSCA